MTTRTTAATGSARVKKATGKKKTYVTPPPVNYTTGLMPVGILTKAFASGDGPQRDRPQDKSSYITSLRARSKAYGEYNPVILRPRVVSDRGNEKFWPLDGNGSNHWLENMFGPDFQVPVYRVTGLTLREENTIFQQIQRGKHVTRNEQFGNDSEYDDDSESYKIEQVMKETGFHTTNHVKESWGVGATTSLWICKRYGYGALKDVLEVISTIYRDDEWKRTNGALVKAIVTALHNQDYDRDVLLTALRSATAEDLAEGARGSGGESIVLPRIASLYQQHMRNSRKTVPSAW